MFYPASVCLSVCRFATSRKNYRSEGHRFWYQSTARIESILVNISLQHVAYYWPNISGRQRLPIFNALVQCETPNFRFAKFGLNKLEQCYGTKHFSISWYLKPVRRYSRVWRTDRQTDGRTDGHTSWQQMPRLTVLCGQEIEHWMKRNVPTSTPWMTVASPQSRDEPLPAHRSTE